jgi:hypothetical protein
LETQSISSDVQLADDLIGQDPTADFYEPVHSGGITLPIVFAPRLDCGAYDDYPAIDKRNHIGRARLAFEQGDLTVCLRQRPPSMIWGF